MGETLMGKVAEPLRLMVQVANLLDQKTHQTLGVLDQVEKDKWDVINGIRACEVKVEQFKKSPVLVSVWVERPH